MSGSGVTIDGDVYTLDADGNRTAKQDDLAGVTSNYTYDKIYELTQVTQGANTTESYSYDPVGNRLSSLGLSPYNVNTSNELTSTPNASYAYDSNGNTTSKTNSNGTTNYSWDFENRLTQVTLPGQGGTVQFKYDPFGRRIYKSSSSATTIYAYDGDNVVETTNSSGGILSRFAQGQNIDEPLAESTSGATDYYEADGLGSITSLTNGTGTVAQTYTYDSFGNVTHSTGSLANPFQYTARDFDSETGLYYYRARYYDPAVGRFLTEDPFESFGHSNTIVPAETNGFRIESYRNSLFMYISRRFGSANPLGLRENVDKYTYALGNPVIDEDPLGLWTIGIGITVNVQWGIVNIEGSYGVVVDNSGNVGVYGTAGVGGGVGAEASVGVGFSTSTAHTICDLAGPFQYGSWGAGYGIDGTVDEFSGFNADGSPIIGGGMTVGAGVGGGVSGGMNGTIVIPSRSCGCS